RDLRTVASYVRDPRSSRQVWSRYHGYPGDGAYLEFHKIRFPGGLKFWRVTGPDVDLGGKQAYDPNAARARAYGHAAHYRWLLRAIAAEGRRAGGEVIVAPFDTELFGHWWFEGVEFLADLFRGLQGAEAPQPGSASARLSRRPSSRADESAARSQALDGDFA